MTEDELKNAVHKYADMRAMDAYRVPVSARQQTEAWTKLTEAIHAWTEQKRAADISSLNRYYEIVGHLNERIAAQESAEKALRELQGKQKL